MEAIGIAAAALQFADAARQLVQFCKLLKQAPEQLLNIWEDALLLEALLQQLAKPSQSSQSRPDYLWDLCRGHCALLTLEMLMLVDQLRRAFRQDRLMGSLKAVMKEGRLESLRQRQRDTPGLIMALKMTHRDEHM